MIILAFVLQLLFAVRLSVGGISRDKMILWGYKIEENMEQKLHCCCYLEPGQWTGWSLQLESC